MNWDEISGGWAQIKGKARQQWGELTDNDLDQIGGRKDQLLGLIQEKYGHLREVAERELDEWAAALRPAAETLADEAAQHAPVAPSVVVTEVSVPPPGRGDA
jgi:uncharacterized protein YjbJ (UPF0337 family)